MSKQVHQPISSNIPSANTSEDIEGQLDRLNQALQVVMKEIEANGCSRNASRLSAVNADIFADDEVKSQSVHSEENFIPDGFEEKIEELLTIIDCKEMIIEDYRSEEIRRIENSAHQETHRPRTGCTHDINKIRREIWLQVKLQKNELLEKEKKSFEDKLVLLDQLKEDYERKRVEIVIVIQKLKQKEDLLNQKEKDIRMQRMAFDKHKMLWEQKNSIESGPTIPYATPPPVGHLRAVSYNITTNIFSEGSNSRTKSNALDKFDGKIMQTVVEMQANSPSKPDQLKHLKGELKSLEEQLEKQGRNPQGEISDIEMSIDSLKNKIATLRGEIAINESNKATKIINNMMVSMKRDIGRDDKLKRIELLEEMNKKNSSVVNTRFGEITSFSTPNPIRIKPLDVKTSDNPETTRRFLGVDAPNPRGAVAIRNEKEEASKSYADYKKKILIDKEKELSQRETLLQQTWMKIPGAKELIENVNLTLSKLTSEKSILEKERDDFEKEKLDWIRNKEKFIMNSKKDDKK
ncbi:hypothetical protein SteCoe_11066 [Stentor coeruleus]|uniref:Uncharacterized protein n=1 Tax=Stentor coeruleus TaxID=5963 RepID=A0A1R2CE28_9CILI|nr:hypothetical protein SteCoe_11066 [Stentor coeruleus]